jgi:hypothetical protein
MMWQKAETIKRRFEQKHSQAETAASAAALLSVAEWALAHRLLPEFVKTMKEAAKLDGKLPAVVAFQQVYEQLSKPPATDDPTTQDYVEDFRSQGYKPDISDQGHYILFADPAQDDPAAVQRRLRRLEETYQSFFYWFALHGKVLPLPRHRLVVVMEKDINLFRTRYAAFDNTPLVADGFTARRDNVVLISPRRLDEAYNTLARNNKAYQENLKLNRDELLTGAVHNRRTNAGKEQIQVLQLLTLVQRAMEEESEQATLTHEGIRQLLAATGLLPRNVAAGEWVRYGLASFFETSHTALYPTLGLPNWTNLVAFKQLRMGPVLASERAPQVLRGVITDAYFRQAYVSLAKAGRNPHAMALHAKAYEDLELARATAWSLTHYLMTKKLDNLVGYLQELSNLPRDTVHDAAVLQACFGRAFRLAPADTAKPNGQVGQGMHELAVAWFAAMDVTYLDFQAFEQWARAERTRSAAGGGAAEGPK